MQCIFLLTLSSVCGKQFFSKVFNRKKKISYKKQLMHTRNFYWLGLTVDNVAIINSEDFLVRQFLSPGCNTKGN